MQTVATLPILQTVSDVTTHYLGLQPAISGTTTAEYVNAGMSFNPSSNTLTLNVKVSLPKSTLAGDVIVPGTITGNLIASGTITGNAIASPPDIFDDALLLGGM
jgi:hypothetical protein